MSAGIASPRSSLGESIGINPNSHVFSTCFSAGASRGSIQNKAAARESNLHIREKRNMIPSHLLQFLGHRRRLVQFPQRLAPRRDEPVIERRVHTSARIVEPVHTFITAEHESPALLKSVNKTRRRQFNCLYENKKKLTLARALAGSTASTASTPR